MQLSRDSSSILKNILSIDRTTRRSGNPPDSTIQNRPTSHHICHCYSRAAFYLQQSNAELKCNRQCSQAMLASLFLLYRYTFVSSYMYTLSFFFCLFTRCCHRYCLARDLHFFGSSFLSPSAFPSAFFSPSPSCALCCPEMLCHMFLRKPSSWWSVVLPASASGFDSLLY
jgi:hypothetical protein